MVRRRGRWGWRGENAPAEQGGGGEERERAYGELTAAVVELRKSEWHVTRIGDGPKKEGRPTATEYHMRGLKP
jgi:hypothetical protein